MGEQFTVFVDSTNEPNTTDFYYKFPNTLVLEGNWTVGVQFFSTYNTRHNISAVKANNVFKYSDNTGSYTITVPDGAYGIEELNGYLLGQFISNASFQVDVDTGEKVPCIAITPNYSTGLVDIQIQEFTNSGANTVNIFFDDVVCEGLADLLGFSHTQIQCLTGATRIVSSGNEPSVNNGITSFHLHADIASRSFLNGQESDILLVYTPRVSPYSLVTVEPINILYLPLSRSKISSIRFYLRDNLGGTVDLEGEALNINLVFKRFNQ